MINEPETPQFYHPVMKDGKVQLEERGLVRIIGYFLEVKISGDHASLLEDQLRSKLENLIRRIKIGDGSQIHRVSKLAKIYEVDSTIKADEKRIKAVSEIKALKSKLKIKKLSSTNLKSLKKRKDK